MEHAPESLLRALQCALEADRDVRAAAEAHLQQCKAAEPALALQLVHVALQPEYPLAIRQLALTTLKGYVQTHWSPKTEKFTGPEAPEAVKVQARQLLLERGIRDATPRIRVASAYVVSKIAQISWPEEWPEFLPFLLAQFRSTQPELVHGPLAVLKGTQLVREDLTEHHLPDIIEHVLPQLLAVYNAGEGVLPRSMRNTAVSIFKDLVELFYNAKESNPAQISAMVRSLLPSWMTALATHALQRPAVVRSAPGSEIDDDATMHVMHSKLLAMRAVNYLVMAFPKETKEFLVPVFQCAWADVRALAYDFPLDQLDSIEEDSDGDAVSGEALFFVHAEFIQRVQSKAPVAKLLLDPASGVSLADLVAVLLTISRVTDARAEVWAEDINRYISEELEDDAMSYSPRTAAIELVHRLLETHHAAAVPVLRHAALHVLETRSDDGRLVEAALTFLSTVIEEQHDAPALLASILSLPVATSNVLVRARAIRLIGAAPFADQAQAGTAVQFTLGALGAGNPILFACATRALLTLVDTPAGTPFRAQVQGPILTALAPFLASAAGEARVFLLESLIAAIRLDPVAAAPAVPALVAPLLHVWQQHLDDVVVAGLLTDAVAAMAGSPAGLESLTGLSGAASAPGQPSTLPLLVSVLTSAQPESGCLMAPLDLAAALLRAARKLNHAAASAAIIGHIYGPAIAALSTTDDAEALVAGQQCLRLILDTVPDVTHLPAPGVAPLVAFIARMLHPDQSEARALYIGDLVQALLLRAADALGADLLPQMLGAVLVRLADAKTSSFIQRLVLIFARLLMSEAYYEGTMQALVSTATPDGGNALTLLMRQWVETHDVFMGALDIKLSTHTLGQLFLKQDPRMNSVLVPGKTREQAAAAAAAADTGRRVTRSQAAKQGATAATAPTVIPVFARILQLLVADLAYSDAALAKDAAGGAGADFEDDDDEDDDDYGDWDDASSAGGDGEHLLLSEMIGGFGDDDDDEGEFDDEDDALAPENEWLKQLKIRDYLRELLVTAARNNVWDIQSRMAQILTESQAQVLVNLVNSPTA
ncbi:hypothetical protein H9P43_002622 [Blastocladiella emersonii ATCC 22665]|nr:hypothetical protein H9P43_002622 [Blastocladiella emersonii ATCC 22665]